MYLLLAESNECAGLVAFGIGTAEEMHALATRLAIQPEYWLYNLDWAPAPNVPSRILT